MSGKKGMKSRRDVMYRSFQLRDLFEAGEVTVQKVAKEFEISRQSAQKWIDVASLFLPVYEIREEQARGFKRKVYGLLK